MTAEVCLRCGWVMGASVSACPACGSPLETRSAGAETNYFPEPEAAEPGPMMDPPPQGTVLLPAAARRQAPRAPLRLKLQPLLTFECGVLAGRQVVVEGPKAVVGREEASIRIDDPALSSRHFVIEERGQEYFLRDLDSTNGTFLNGHPVRSAKLESGDKIRAGETTLLFSIRQVIPWD